MKTNYIILSAIILLLMSCKDSNKQYIVQQEKINETVYASGNIFPEQYIYIKSSKDNYINRIFVSEGSLINKGDKLITYGNQIDSIYISNLQKQIALTEANLSENSPLFYEINSKLKLAEYEYTQDSIYAAKYLNLANIGAVSKKEADVAFRKKEKSFANYLSVNNSYKLTRNEQLQKLMKIKNSLLQSETTLFSTISGKVYSINVHEGDFVNSNDLIMLIGKRKMKLELLIDERDIRKLELGQVVYFKTDTYPNSSFRGMVSHIDKTLQKKSRCFKIVAQLLDNPSNGFYPLSTVEANIIIKSRNALIIPQDFLLEDSYVIKKIGSQRKKTKIIVGIRTNDKIEIISGIEKGDIIFKE